MQEKIENLFSELINELLISNTNLIDEANSVRDIRDRTLLKLSGYKKVTLRAYLNDFASIAFLSEDTVIPPNLKQGTKLFLDRKECTVQDVEFYNGAGQNGLDLVRIVVTKN